MMAGVMACRAARGESTRVQLVPFRPRSLLCACCGAEPADVDKSANEPDAAQGEAAPARGDASVGVGGDAYFGVTWRPSATLLAAGPLCTMMAERTETGPASTGDSPLRGEGNCPLFLGVRRAGVRKGVAQKSAGERPGAAGVRPERERLAIGACVLACCGGHCRSASTRKSNGSQQMPTCPSSFDRACDTRSAVDCSSASSTTHFLVAENSETHSATASTNRPQRAKRSKS